jgi:hypothetical protein
MRIQHAELQSSGAPILGARCNRGRPYRFTATAWRTVWALIPPLILLAFNVSATTVWTWVDSEGVKHYSQVPLPGATRVVIGPSNRAAPSLPNSSPSSLPDPPRATTPSVSAKYAELSIVQPAEGETFVNTGGVVPVNVRLDPALRRGHSIVFYLDDHRVGGIDPTARSFALQDVPRGTHLLVAVVQDERRVSLQEAAVTFYVRQHSIIQPNAPKPVQPLPKER